MRDVSIGRDSPGDSDPTAEPTTTKTYYVATDGNDSGPGNSRAPFRTVQHAVDVAQAGDLVLVHGGVYQENVHFTHGGADGAPIVLKNVPGEKPVLVSTSPDDNTVLLEAEPSTDDIPIGWVTIEGFDVEGGITGIKLMWAHHITVRGNYIHDNPGSGVLGFGHDILFEKNVVTRNGDFVTNQCHGLNIVGQRRTIRNNLIYKNSSHGIVIGANGCDPSRSDCSFLGAVDWLIANNIFAFEQNRSGVLVWIPGPEDSDPANGKLSNIEIANNIFYENNLDNPEDVNGSASGARRETRRSRSTITCSTAGLA